MAELLANKTTVQAILAAHMVPERITLASFRNGTVLETLNPYVNLTVTVNGPSVYVQPTGGAPMEVLAADVDGGAAVAHVVDGVILPGLPGQGKRRRMALAT